MNVVNEVSLRTNERNDLKDENSNGNVKDLVLAPVITLELF